MNNVHERPRKIGSVTLGISLIVIGVVFMFVNFDSREQIILLFRFWPLILIALGIETLISIKLHPEYTLSITSVFIIAALLAFAFFMAFSELAYSYYMAHGYIF